MFTSEIILILVAFVFFMYWAFINLKSWLNFYFDENDRFDYFDYDDYIKNNYNLRVIIFLMKLVIVFLVISITYFILQW